MDPRQLVDESFKEGNLGNCMLQDFRTVYSEYKQVVQDMYLGKSLENSGGECADEETIRHAISMLHSVAATASLNLLMDTLLNTVCNHFGLENGDPRIAEIQEHMAYTAKKTNDVILAFLEDEGVPVMRIDEQDTTV